MANTTPQLSEVGVANMAAVMIGEANLTSLDDNSPIGRFMSREFGYTRDELLQTYPYHFAMTRAAVPADADEPAFGWAYAYTLPDDCLRLLPITKLAVLNGEPVPYELEDRRILTDYESASGVLWIRYVKRATVISKWSPLAARTLGCRLAVIGASRITGKLSYLTAAKQAYAESLWESKHADSLERGTPETVYSGTGDYDAISIRGV